MELWIAAVAAFVAVAVGTVAGTRLVISETE
jgi:uncharacterized protein YqfA (UPF0365 family)